MPKVSVIIPTYNCKEYVTIATESVLAQTFKDYELIVVDDGSTDETSQVLEQYEDRITYIYQENRERSAARNTGIRASSGEYLAFLDADDTWLPNKLEQQVTILDQDSDIVLTYCQALYIDSCGNPVQYLGKWATLDDQPNIVIADQSRELILGNAVVGGGSTVMVRASLLTAIGLFDETLSYPEDWDLWARLSRQGPFAYIPKPLACYRVYGWDRILPIEASEQLVAQHLKVIEKAVEHWHRKPDERNQLYAQATANIYIRAALANFQLGHGLDGRFYLEKAMLAEPELQARARLIQLAVDRAKLIETETGSFQKAEKFINTFFSNLPMAIAKFKNARREAVGWLYVAGAFEKRDCGDKATVRHLLWQGIIRAPVSITNLGVASTALETYLGRSVANALRKLTRLLLKLTGRPLNAKC